MAPTQFRVIAIVGGDDTQILDITGPAEIFSRCRRLLESSGVSDPRPYRVVILASSQTRRLRTSSGIVLETDALLSEFKEPIDTLLVAGGTAIEMMRGDDPLVEWLRNHFQHIRRVGAVCTGAFALAHAGLLSGRKATTHWAWCERLAHRFPDIEVDADPIFIRDANLYTSAGVTAGMDLALALVEEDHGSRVVMRIARELVLYLRRPGTQSQFSTPLAGQMSERAPIRELQLWLAVNWHLPITIDGMASQAGMSPRHFARVFARDVGATPAQYLERLRVHGASLRLAESSLGLERIAIESGYASADVMRRSFLRVLRINPEDYRARFRATSPRSVPSHLGPDN